MYNTVLKKLFFNKNPAYNLGLCRILFYGLCLEELWSKDYTVEVFYYSQLLPKELWTPVGVFNFYPKDMMYSLAETYMLLNILCACLFFSMVGFLTRISAGLSFFIALLFLGYPNNFGTVSNSSCLFLVTMFILIFSNMGETLSVDNLLKKKNTNTENKRLNLFWSLWTVKLITVLTCLFYFTSGIQKLRLSGLNWFLSDHMAISFLDMGHPIGSFLSQFFLVCKFIAFSGFAIQILSFIPIIFPRTIFLFLILFCVFHIIIDITFGTHFDKHFIVLIFLFPWGSLLPQLPGNFKGNFWPALFSLRHIKEKNSIREGRTTIIMTTVFLVSLFVIAMSIYAPYKLQHLYPFSTTTMYAWIDKEPVKRKKVFVVDRDKKRHVKRTEIWPLTYDRLFSKLKRMEKDNEPVSKQKDILRQIQNLQPVFNKGVYTLEFIKKMTLENCFWHTTENYILRSDQPDYCNVFIEESF